jgi:hypothetical protein
MTGGATVLESPRRHLTVHTDIPTRADLERLLAVPEAAVATADVMAP